jgi:exopolysaccharide production protein ExoZ
MLYNLQVLRGFAAIAVAFYHTDFRLAGDWHTDFTGVAIFFVISGFIMCFITRADPNDFLMKRAIRIVPMYWLCTLLLILVNHRLRIVNPLFWIKSGLTIDFPRSILFLPAEKFPLLGVGWTLNLEVYFYVVFAAALLISRRFAPIIAAAVILAVIQLDVATGEGIFLLHYYAHSYIHYFVYGIILYYAWVFLSPYVRPVVAVPCIAIAAMGFGLQFVEPLWPAWILPYLAWIPVAVAASALFAESAGSSITWRPLVLLGDASYAVYLTHTIFYEVLRPYLRDAGLPTAKESLVVMLAEVTLATLVAIAIHLYVEKPLLAKIRASIQRRRQLAFNPA